MKKYTDQGKVDTRSGFGAHAFLPVLFAMIVVSSCFSPLFENEPYGSVRIIQYISEYELNGEYVCDTLDLEYSRFHYKHWYFPMFFISLKGVAYLKNAENHTIDLYGIDYEHLSIQWNCMHYDYDAERDYNYRTNSITFRFSGDGAGPFIEGVEYSWPEGLILENRDTEKDERVTNAVSIWMKGCDRNSANDLKTFRVLSSSFKLAYGEIDDKYVRDVLDIYFDLEMVVEKGPEERIAEKDPIVGDTIRVKNGHFIQSLFCYDTDFLHKIIVPNETLN